MSALDVKVGDEIIVTPRWTGEPRRVRVEKVGRAYVHAGGLRFSVEDGQCVDHKTGTAAIAYSLAGWDRRQARDGLRAAVEALAKVRIAESLSAAECREMAAVTNALANRLRGAA